MKKRINKATIFSARVFQIIARISMIIITIVGSFASSTYMVFLTQINDDFRLILYFIVEILILLILTSLSFVNELAGSAFWIVYCIIAFFYLHYRIPHHLSGLWINYVILYGGIAVGLLLFFTWYIEWNDPLYRILRRVEHKSFEDS